MQTTQILLSSLAPADQINAAGYDDSVAARLARSTYKFQNGPTGQEYYYDNVIGLGHNVLGDFSADDSNHPSESIRLESKYYQSGAFGSEFIVGIFPTSGVGYAAGGEDRMIYGFMPHDMADSSKSFLVEASDQHVFADWHGQTMLRIEKNSNLALLYNGLAIRSVTNNVPILQQSNVGGDVNQLILSNARNETEMRQPLYIVGPSTAGVAGRVALQTMVDTHPTNGGAMISGAVYAPVTGNYAALDVFGNASISMYSQITNNNGTGIAAFIARTVSGSTMFEFGTGNVPWTMVGLANGNFGLYPSLANTGVRPAWTIQRGTLQMQLGGSLRLASYSMATLPVAQIAGAGSLIWITDNSQGATLAVSDGVTWRAVPPTAVIGQPAGGSAPALVTSSQSVQEASPTNGDKESAVVVPAAKLAAKAAGMPEQTEVGPLERASADDAEREDSSAGYTGGADFEGTSTNTVSAASAADQLMRSQVQSLSDRTDSLEGRVGALEAQSAQYNGGIAAAMALGGTMMPPDLHVAFSFNLSTFRGQQGYSLTGAAKISPHIYVSGGVAGSTAKHSTGGRAGVTVGW